MNHTGRSPDHEVYELGIEGDIRRYVGYRRIGEALVARQGSSLAEFLADGAKELAGTLPSLALNGPEAVAICYARRRQAVAAGFRLVLNQQISPWPARKPIKLILPDGRAVEFRSQREFGRMTGIAPSTVREWVCNDCIDYSRLAGRSDCEGILRDLELWLSTVVREAGVAAPR